MNLGSIRRLVRSRLEEYIILSQSGNEIDLNELSGDITSIILDLSDAGVVVYDESYSVPIERVQITVNQHGVIVIKFNQEAM